VPGLPVGGTGLGVMGKEPPEVGVVARPVQLVVHDAVLRDKTGRQEGSRRAWRPAYTSAALCPAAGLAGGKLQLAGDSALAVSWVDDVE
jgi:hypothetical protein